MRFNNIIKLWSTLVIITLMAVSCSLFEEVNVSDAEIELYGDNPYGLYDGTANDADGNDDGEFSQGESIRIQLRAKNNGSEAADKIKMTISTDDEYVTVVSGSKQTLGDMSIGNSQKTPDANTSGSILLSAAQGTPDGHIVDFDVEFEDDFTSDWNDEFSIVVEPINASILLYGNNPYDIYDGSANGVVGNDDGIINVGETVRLKLRVRNENNSGAMQVKMIVSTEDQYISVIDDSTYTLGDMSAYRQVSTPDANSPSGIMISVDASTPSGHTATINILCTDKFENQWTDNFSIIIQ
jgi:hypothetical protein